MIVSFQKAKSGDDTCTVGGTPLHSRFDPKVEGERFAESALCDFSPRAIILLEPALGYCVPPLKKRFPSASIISIRYTKEFDGYNSFFDKVFYCPSNIPGPPNISNLEDKESAALENSLIEGLGAKVILSSLFLEWGPSGKAFPEEAKKIKTIIRAVLKKAQSVLITKSFFARRWIINTIYFCRYIKTTATLPEIKKPIVIAGSGPTLEDAIDPIKKYRKKIFLLSTGSALRALAARGIRPDLAIATDGGYYGKRHLYNLTPHPPTPLAAPGEAAVPHNLLKDLPIAPLLFADSSAGVVQGVFDAASAVHSTTLPPAPTVTGSALLLGERLTSGALIFIGLDLMTNKKGFSHCAPNENVITTRLKTNRLSNLMTEQVRDYLSFFSLDAYRTWFSQHANKNLYRVVDPARKVKKVPGLNDLSPKDFQSLISNAKSEDTPIKISSLPPACKKNGLTAVEEYIKTISKTYEWLKSTQPLKFLQYEKAQKDTEKSAIYSQLESENERLLKKIKSFFNADKKSI